MSPTSSIRVTDVGHWAWIFMGTRDLPNPGFFILKRQKRNEMKSKNDSKEVTWSYIKRYHWLPRIELSWVSRGSRAGRRKQDGVRLGPHLTCNYSSVPTVPTVKNNSAKTSEMVKQVKSLSSKRDNLSSPIPRTHTIKNRVDPHKFSSHSHRYTTACVHTTPPYTTPPHTH